MLGKSVCWRSAAVSLLLLCASCLVCGDVTLRGAARRPKKSRLVKSGLTRFLFPLQDDGHGRDLHEIIPICCVNCYCEHVPPMHLPHRDPTTYTDSISRSKGKGVKSESRLFHSYNSSTGNSHYSADDEQHPVEPQEPFCDCDCHQCGYPSDYHHYHYHQHPHEHHHHQDHLQHNGEYKGKGKAGMMMGSSSFGRFIHHEHSHHDYDPNYHTHEYHHAHYNSHYSDGEDNSHYATCENHYDHPCYDGQRCAYGQEICCGEVLGPAEECTCKNGDWYCHFNEYCNNTSCDENYDDYQYSNYSDSSRSKGKGGKKSFIHNSSSASSSKYHY